MLSAHRRLAHSRPSSSGLRRFSWQTPPHGRRTASTCGSMPCCIGGGTRRRRAAGSAVVGRGQGESGTQDLGIPVPQPRLPSGSPAPDPRIPSPSFRRSSSTPPRLPLSAVTLRSSVGGWLFSYAAATVITGMAILGAWVYKVSHDYQVRRRREPAPTAIGRRK